MQGCFHKTIKIVILFSVNLDFVTRLTISHNKIKCKLLMKRINYYASTHSKILICMIPAIPATIANLCNLEILTMFNNQLEELPTAISSLPKLRILNVG